MWSDVNHFILTLFSRLQVQREDGQALVEYTLILALVSIAAIVILGTVGVNIVNKLTTVANSL